MDAQSRLTQGAISGSHDGTPRCPAVAREATSGRFIRLRSSRNASMMSVIFVCVVSMAPIPRLYRSMTLISTGSIVSCSFIWTLRCASDKDQTKLRRDGSTVEKTVARPLAASGSRTRVVAERQPALCDEADRTGSLREDGGRPGRTSAFRPSRRRRAKSAAPGTVDAELLRCDGPLPCAHHARRIPTVHGDHTGRSSGACLSGAAGRCFCGESGTR